MPRICHSTWLLARPTLILPDMSNPLTLHSLYLLFYYSYGNANGRHPLRQLTAENGGTMKWFEQVDDGEGPLIKNKDKDKSKL